MAGGCGINNDNLIVRLFHNLCKCPEHGDFLCAGGAQIFFNVGNILLGQAVGSRFGQHFLLIIFQLGVFVDVAHSDIIGLLQHKF